MIGLIRGKVLFSDGREALVLTASGIAYQVKTPEIFPKGQMLEIYTCPVIKENSQELFGFSSMREKKLFQLILNVKGVGPKGAFGLVHSLGFENAVGAIIQGDKRALQKAPGIGAKAAAQILLDLEQKIAEIATDSSSSPTAPLQKDLLNDTLLACEQLGLKPEQVTLAAQKLLKENNVTGPEQLVHLILKEMQ